MFLKNSDSNKTCLKKAKLFGWYSLDKVYFPVLHYANCFYTTAGKNWSLLCEKKKQNNMKIFIFIEVFFPSGQSVSAYLLYLLKNSIMLILKLVLGCGFYFKIILIFSISGARFFYGKKISLYYCFWTETIKFKWDDIMNGMEGIWELYFFSTRSYQRGGGG